MNVHKCMCMYVCVCESVRVQEVEGCGWFVCMSVTLNLFSSSFLGFSDTLSLGTTERYYF